MQNLLLYKLRLFFLVLFVWGSNLRLLQVSTGSAPGTTWDPEDETLGQYVSTALPAVLSVWPPKEFVIQIQEYFKKPGSTARPDGDRDKDLSRTKAIVINNFLGKLSTMPFSEDQPFAYL